MIIRYFLILIILLLNSSLYSQTESLRGKIEDIISTKKTIVGVSINGFSENDTLSINGNEHFPMQSVYKFHLALAILNLVEQGKYNLSQTFYTPEFALRQNTWSPFRDKYPEGNVIVTLEELLGYTVSQNDNNTCDILFQLAGGTSVVNNYIHSIGMDDVSIAATEEEMAEGKDIQFTNWTSPLCATKLLVKFNNNEIIPKYYDFLWKVMTETSTGPKRLKGLLPEGTVVAHKTGTSDTNEEGITAAINDIGIVVLPDGRRYSIAVFVSNSKESLEVNESIIANVSKVVYDYYLNNTSK
jgi:beta-lactamase class A